MKREKRLEQNYAEALASLGDPKNMYGALEEITQILLRNLESRIQWKINDAAARNPHQPVSLTVEVAEMERIGRIHAMLQDPRLDDYRNCDPGAGAKEIVRILELARREHGSGKAENHDGAGVKEAPENESNKISQNPTLEAEEATGIERGPAISNLCLARGKIRRGHG